MKHTNVNPIKNNKINKDSIKVIIGGPLGILAWSASAGTMLIIFVWGLEKSALAVIIVKMVSWGMWGMGVLRENLKKRVYLLNKTKKSSFHLSWGLIFCLRSMGERKRPSYHVLLMSLSFHRECHVPAEYHLSELTHTHFHLPEPNRRSPNPSSTPNLSPE
ncbi:hypothetical protein [Nitrosococcus watsonii]|uniref:Uncharacterized protein n=1 Tax=Nitrosococcus watsoni (strain C-113) TaxID=105559 RepID=D8K5E2_NITWC|nr:hypothetical protein [Nitrosococcus watsonii]ADJ28119.1 conserved hypothetical protein [Nitrosococcus watsonii C-113]